MMSEKDTDTYHPVVTTKGAVFSDVCTHGPPDEDSECMWV